MKALFLSLSLAFAVLIGSRVASHSAPSTSPNGVLQAILDKLHAIGEIQYNYYREVNYRSENHHSELSGSTYLDFRARENVAGFRFQIINPTYKSIYNGQSLFTVEENDKKLTIYKQPVRDDFAHLSFFYNSPVTLRNSLNTIITNSALPKSVSDTTINGRAYDMVRFALKSQTLQNLGGLNSLSTDRTIFYKIIADKQNHLPFVVIQTNSVTPEDYVLTRFTNLKVNTNRPDEKTWHYINYVNDYKPVYRN